MAAIWVIRVKFDGVTRLSRDFNGCCFQLSVLFIKQVLVKQPSGWWKGRIETTVVYFFFDLNLPLTYFCWTTNTVYIFNDLRETCCTFIRAIFLLITPSVRKSTNEFSAKIRFRTLPAYTAFYLFYFAFYVFRCHTLSDPILICIGTL